MLSISKKPQEILAKPELGSVSDLSSDVQSGTNVLLNTKSFISIYLIIHQISFQQHFSPLPPPPPLLDPERLEATHRLQNSRNRYHCSPRNQLFCRKIRTGCHWQHTPAIFLPFKDTEVAECPLWQGDDSSNLSCKVWDQQQVLSCHGCECLLNKESKSHIQTSPRTSKRKGTMSL